MPAIDLKALKWTRIFRDFPAYPDLLTQKNWDSKKGKIAKMAGTTGIGDQMKDTFDAFKKLENSWPLIQGKNSITVEKEKKAAIAFIGSAPLKNLHNEFKTLRDLAEKTRDRFKKNKLIPSSATKLCDEIREASDLLFVATNANTLSGLLSTAIEENHANRIAVQKKQADLVVKGCKTVPAKISKAVSDWRKVINGVAGNEEKFEKARQVIKENMFSRARDMTQNIANFDNCEKAGVEWENYDSRAIQVLLKKLVPYANGTGQDLAGLSATEIEKHIKVIEDGGVEFERLTKNIKIKGT